MIKIKDLKNQLGTCSIDILRNETFIDIIIENSLGCGFITTDSKETEKIKDQFSKKIITILKNLKITLL